MELVFVSIFIHFGLLKDLNVELEHSVRVTAGPIFKKIFENIFSKIGPGLQTALF